MITNTLKLTLIMIMATACQIVDEQGNTSNIAAPETERTENTEPTNWGIGNPERTHTKWIGEPEEITYNPFHELEVGEFCLPKTLDLNTAGFSLISHRWEYKSSIQLFQIKLFLNPNFNISTHYTLDEINTAAAKMVEYLEMQNMVKDVDFEIQIDTRWDVYNTIQITLLNDDLDYGITHIDYVILCDERY